MSTVTAEATVGRRKADPEGMKPAVDMAKIHSDVMRDARITVALTGEGLTEYLSRLLRPLVARDKDDALKKEQTGKAKR